MRRSRDRGLVLLEALAVEPRSGMEAAEVLGQALAHTLRLIEAYAEKGWVAHDRAMWKWVISDEGRAELGMRRRRRKEGLVMHEEQDRRAQVKKLDAVMWGVHAPAMAAVVDDPDLRARLEAAIGAGMPELDLADVAKYKRPAAVDEALTAFASARVGGPCSVCGSAVRRWGPDARYWAAPDTLPPPFAPATVTVDGKQHDIVLCGWCSEESGQRVSGIERIAEKALCAIAGYKGGAGGKRVRLAFEVPGLGDGTPWGHVVVADVLDHARRQFAAGSWSWMRRVTAPGQAGLLRREVPGTHPKIWADGERPAPAPRPVVLIRELSRSQASLAAEAAEVDRRQRQRLARKAMVARHAVESEQWVAAHPFDHVDGLLGRDAEAYQELLDRQRRELRDLGAESSGRRPAASRPQSTAWVNA